MNPLITALLLFVAGPAQTPDRARHLEEQLLAPCCYSESVARHRSEVSLQIKREIAAMIAEGKSDDEIMAVYKSRYGERILMEPEGRKGVALTLTPVLTIIAGVVFTSLMIRRMRKPPAPAASAPGGELPDLPDD